MDASGCMSELAVCPAHPKGVVFILHSSTWVITMYLSWLLFLEEWLDIEGLVSLAMIESHTKYFDV